jgi:hypothetical protein
MKDAKMKYSRANATAGQSQADLQSSSSPAQGTALHICDFHFFTLFAISFTESV